MDLGVCLEVLTKVLTSVANDIIWGIIGHHPLLVKV
jgi:hypothetical protein